MRRTGTGLPVVRSSELECIVDVDIGRISAILRVCTTVLLGEVEGRPLTIWCPVLAFVNIGDAGLARVDAPCRIRGFDDVGNVWKSVELILSYGCVEERTE